MIADSSYEESCVQLFSEKHRENTVTEAASPFMWQKLSLSCSEVMSTLQTYYAEWATKSPESGFLFCVSLLLFQFQALLRAGCRLCAGWLRYFFPHNF